MSYMQEISEYSLLTKSEEYKYGLLAQQGKKEGVDKLVLANLRFVVTIANQYQGQGLPIEDLIQEGNLGLIKATSKFDPTKGFKFVTYACWWIRQHILKALAENTSVRKPSNRLMMLSKVKKAEAELLQEFGRQPTNEEISEKLDGTINVDLVLQEKIPELLLNDYNDSDKERGDIFEDTTVSSTEEILFNEDLKIEINQVLSQFQEREKEIIILYFGLNGTRNLTLEEIGNLYELSRERVRQIKLKVLNKLRNKKNKDSLREFI